MVHFSRQALKGRTINIGKSDGHVLGPDLELDNCHLALQTSQRALTISGVKIRGCSIEAVSPVTNIRWLDAWIEETKFIGRFVGCDFGYWAEHTRTGGGIGSADFSEAVLDGCRFFDTALSSLKLPPAPCIAIPNPKIVGEQLLNLDLPDRLEFWAEGLSWSPEEVSLAVEWMPRIIENFGGSNESLQELLSSASTPVPG